MHGVLKFCRSFAVPSTRWAARLATCLTACLIVGLLVAGGALAADGPMRVGGIDFDSLEDFQHSGSRCGTLDADLRRMLFGMPEVADPSDCSANSTNPSSDYDSTVLYEVPVVFHVMMNGSCSQGDVSDALIESQIEILNEDFLALLGTNGENGTDVQVQFYLADVDPDGNATSGITRSCNDSWYNDNGSYWNTLNWDPDRYMNVYTNNTPFLGYVPFLPADNGGGNVGSASDRVVVTWSAVGRNAPIGPPYNQGRTLTHEVGHYLGLEHTFWVDNQCGSDNAPGCYNDGDLICDTNTEQNARFGCSNGSSCGSPDPTDNYMDYSDDLCMEMFTPEQAKRIRCSLENYRVDLYSVVGGGEPLTLSDPVPGVPGVDNTWTISDAGSGDTVWMVWGRDAGSTSVPGCSGLTVGIDAARPVDSGVADGSGSLEIVKTVPGGVSGTVLFQAVNVDSCSVSNVVSTTF